MNQAQPIERRLEPHAWGRGCDFWGPRHEYRESLIMRVLRSRRQHGRVLNAGCGAGSMTLALLDAGYDVTSFDASEPFVQRLALRLRESRPGVDAPVVVDDICAMSFADSSFDAVVCGEVLEHIEDDRRAIEEIARVLGADGVLVGSVPANPWRFNWVDHWAGHRRRYTSDGLRRLMERAGLEQIQVIPWGFPLTGLYDRLVYRRLLRRRLENAGSPETSRTPHWLNRLARAAFEFDSLFLGRRPGYLGFIIAAKKPGDLRRPRS